MTAAQSAANLSAQAQGTRLRASFSGMPLLCICLLVAIMVAAIDFAIYPNQLTTALGDSDDATRLVELRDLLAGAPWLDMTIARFGWPEHLVSHWSRLVDFGEAAVVRTFAPLVGPATAELIMRAVWPVLLLPPLLFALAGWARDRSGWGGALIAIGLDATSMTGIAEYLPGRIDHHNAMILAAVSGILLLARSFEEPPLGVLAGIAFGLGTAVGYESLLLTLAALALATMLAIPQRANARVVVQAVEAFAGTLTVLWLATTAPQHWLSSRCDALSFNLVALSVCAACGTWLALERGRNWTWQAKLATLAIAGVLGLGIYAASEPACLGGPFGQQDPAIGPIWLDYVTEVQSVFWMIGAAPVASVVFLICVALGSVASLLLVTHDRDDGAKLVLGTLMLAIMLACWQIKLVPYASFLAVAPLASVIARLEGTPVLSRLSMRVIGLVASCQLSLAIVIGPLVTFLLPEKTENVERQNLVHRCIATASVEPLAALSAARIFSDRDLGPFIAALTDHTIFVAPYHRMDRALLTADRIWFEKADAAGRELAGLGVDYVAMCPGLTRTVGHVVDPGSLLARLKRGDVPAFLQTVDLKQETPIRVYKVVR